VLTATTPGALPLVDPNSGELSFSLEQEWSFQLTWPDWFPKFRCPVILNSLVCEDSSGIPVAAQTSLTEPLSAHARENGMHATSGQLAASITDPAVLRAQEQPARHERFLRASKQSAGFGGMPPSHRSRAAGNNNAPGQKETSAPSGALRRDTNESLKRK
jgi:hypothetical protein